MTRFITLKVELVKQGKTQRALAKETKISESIISGIVNGRLNANSVEKSLISSALEKPESELFGEQ